MASNRKSSKPVKKVDEWLAMAEDFLAIRIIVELKRMFEHVRNSLYHLMGTSIAFFLAVQSYPLQPTRYLFWTGLIMISVTTATAILLMLQTERDELLGRIRRTLPAKLQLDLHLFRFLIAWLIPLGAIAVGHLFPEFWKWLVVYVSPLFNLVP